MGTKQSEADIAAGKPKVILFVCTSNTCRFAERLRVPMHQLPAAGWDVRSGGLTDEYEKPGSPASAHSVTAMRQEELDLSTHKSTLLASPHSSD
ncbi:hypothetical protein T484DRAFT_1776670 [Baffinella frigidus]|nr:hypothetical protein T484DRAFT_1776670 [Cryptophyta sp. CCMP2293]